MRLTLVIYSLAAGGAERVMSIIANYWAEKGWHVELLTLVDGNEPPFYQLHPAVMYQPLGIAANSKCLIQGVSNNVKRIWSLRQAIKKTNPQVVISFSDHVNVLTLIAMFGLKIPVIISERSDPAHHTISKGWGILRCLVYPLASRIIVQTQRALTYFSGMIRQHVRVIPNPVRLPNGIETNRKDDFNKKTKTVMSMGRLSEEKGFDFLLRSFAVVSPQYPEWVLEIWGEGPLRSSLVGLRDELGLHGRVYFHGQTKQPFEKMKKADLFVLSSRYEGFPNVLCEAMACGMPVISTDCPSGPREIIRNGVDGVLVPPGDVDALASVMNRLMSDERERKRLASRAIEVNQRFELKKVMDIWEEILSQVVGKNRHEARCERRL